MNPTNSNTFNPTLSNTLNPTIYKCHIKTDIFDTQEKLFYTIRLFFGENSKKGKCHIIISKKGFSNLSLISNIKFKFKLLN